MANMQIQLGNPVLIFIWSFAILLIGITLGVHWHPSAGTTFWMAISGALLMVLHDLFYGLIWCSITGAWIHKSVRSKDSKEDA